MLIFIWAYFMSDMGNSCKILVRKQFEGPGIHGKLVLKWNLKKSVVAQERVQFRALVNMVMNFRVP
jgi:hypothetical protein